MHRTTVMLPQALKGKAEREARRQGMSLGEFIRTSLDRSLAHVLEDHIEIDPLFADAAVYDGVTPPGLSSDHDRYLHDEGVDHSSKSESTSR